ncbi:unnamed protein product [Echinostoma caproni]|uniref:Calmodulin n=1 Tax=Echinostoma caproni TaxID=27848 RepID=A0A183A5Z8_9TREM|nr:unnamed protein product [Echinostoma caproni]
MGMKTRAAGRKRPSGQPKQTTAVTDGAQQFFIDTHEQFVSTKKQSCDNLDLPTYIRRELALHEVHDLRYIFNALDTEQNEYITVYDIKMALFALGFTPENSGMNELLQSINPPEGRYSLINFLEMVVALQDSGNDKLGMITDAFRYFDPGKISLATLEKLTVQVGINLRNDDLVDMIEVADRNGDGYVDLSEFTELMLGTNLFA